ncbi:uracil phosphoribosyltransferase [Rhodobacteraceae bacterium XHP0102]|nr:uracil phosphoribosyltransferase [Rhodobacteraceae bacterium XHP0102]
MSHIDTLTIVDHPLVQHKLSLMRDKTCRSQDFARLLTEISMLMAFALTRDLALTTQAIETPLEPMQAPVLAGKKLALISILRAGNGMLEGMRAVIPAARVGFVGLYRDEVTLTPVEYYLNLPADLANRQVIVLDPMLATGNSAAAAVDKLKSHGAKKIKLMTLLAAPEGVAAFAARHPDVPIFTAALDRGLNDKGYILPGLGDAGDRIFATK